LTDLAAISFLSSFSSFPTPCSLSTISSIVFRIIVDGFMCPVGVAVWYMPVLLVSTLSLSFRSFLSIGFVPRVQGTWEGCWEVVARRAAIRLIISVHERLISMRVAIFGCVGVIVGVRSIGGVFLVKWGWERLPRGVG
jgi:hypothetical protein